MVLEERVKAFCCSSNLFGDPQLTGELVADTWRQLHLAGINQENYATGSCLGTEGDPVQPFKWLITEQDPTHPIYLECPTEALLFSVLNEQKLEPVVFDEDTVQPIIEKLRRAFAVIEKVPAIAYDVKRLVRSIIVLRVEENEIDISYSHPNIPFTIFVSVCEDDTEVSDIRVAESIIHETMHLKLTSIESVVPLVESGSTLKLFSPWKLELRPVQGVLHGFFVFRILHDFYFEMKQFIDPEVEAFVDNRNSDIKLEISEVKDIISSEALTSIGRSFVSGMAGM